ncbi:MAG: T9SS type A sorting domain-containing protein [Nonlabens sp.]
MNKLYKSLLFPLIVIAVLFSYGFLVLDNNHADYTVAKPVITPRTADTYNLDRTGSPLSNGLKCNSCHGGAFNNVSGSITVRDLMNQPVTSYTPGTSYVIEYDIDYNFGFAVGFQAVILDDSNAQAGVSSNPSANTRISTLIGRQYPESSNTVFAASGYTFMTDWTAPAAGTGNVTIYSDAVVGNGDVGSSGDDTLGGMSLSLSELTTNNFPTDITLSNSFINSSATGSNTIVGTLSTTDADTGDTFTYSLVSGTGDSNNGSFNISGNSLRTNGTLSPGVYGVRINTNDGTDDFAKQFNITVTVPPSFSAAFSPSTISSGGSSTLTFTIDNAANSSSVGNLAFTVNLPAGTVVANPANPSTTLTGGTLTATAGSNAISLSGSSLAGGSSATVLVDVTGNAQGSYFMTSSDLTSDFGNSGTASATLTVITPNNAPTDISLSPTSINQSSTGVDATVATLSTTDADSGDTHTYTLVTGTGDSGNANFNINGSSLRSNGALLAGNYSIRINTNDGTDDFEKQFSITIVDDISKGLQLDAEDTNYTIDFDNTVAGVNNGAFVGTGLDGIPAAGQLNSSGFLINGLSDGDTTDGGAFDSGDYARGASTGGVGGGGLYAFDVSNVGTPDVALGVQATGGDFTPGDIILRVQNNTGAVITTLDVAYEVLTYNDQARSQSITLSHGATAAASNGVTALDYATEEAVFTPLASTWKANYFTTQLTGLNIADGVAYFIKWSSADLSGSGSRDEFALDDIQVIANSSNTSVTANASYQDMKVNGSLALTQPTDIEGGLNISGGNLTTNDNLTFKSINYSGTIRTAILEEVQNGGTITGNVTVEQFYPANRAFRFLSSSTTPIDSSGSIFNTYQEGGANTPGLGTHITGGSAANGFDQSLSNNPSLFLYDPTGINGNIGWIPFNDNFSTINGAIFPTIAFRIFVRGDRTVSLATTNATATATTLRTAGRLITGDLTFESGISSQFPFGADGSFYLMPNPYQAQMDLSQTIVNNSEDINQTTYWAWVPSINNYVAYDFSTGGLQNGVSQFIQPNQAYFIQTDEASGSTAGYDPSVTYMESQKSTAVTATATYSQPESEYSIRLFTPETQGGFIATDMVRGFINTGYDNGINNRDAVKFTGLSEQLSILSNGVQLSNERREQYVDEEVLQLQIGQMQTGTYDLELNFRDFNGLEVYLVDNHLNTRSLIAQNQIIDHSFDVDLNDAGSFAADRFQVEFETGTLSAGDLAFAKAVQLYPNPTDGNELNISGLKNGTANVTILGLLGQTIYEQEHTVLSGSAQVNGLENLTSGVYLVAISQNGKSATKRLIVK